MRRLLLLAALCSACGSSSPAPTAPTSPPVSTPTVPTAPAIGFSGTLSATNGGQPLSGISISSGGITDGSGRFTVPANTGSLTFSGVSILTRVVNLQTPGHAFGVDAITLGSVSGFDLAFYRALVRNGYEAPGQLEPIHGWAAAPNVYVRTIDDAGAAVDAATLSTTTSALSEVAATWTGGKFGLASLTTGTSSKEGVSGWITVKWSSAPTAQCGLSTVGVSGGYIQLDRFTARCQCAAGQTAALVRPATVKHELGHSFGFWHTGNQADLMSGLGDVRCNIDPDDRERYHAAIAYKRPIGNTDPDTDPSFVTLSHLGAERVVVD